MKKQFKIAAAITSLTLILSLSACGSKDISGEVTTAAPSGTATESPASEESTYSMGSASGGVYTSDFLGIGCKLDESWIFSSEDELVQLAGVISESINNEDLSKKLESSLESGQLIYDMAANNSVTFANINISIENLGIIYGSALDESAYIDLALDSTKSTLESSGFTNLTLEKSTIDFAGASRQCIKINGDYSGISTYETLICLKKGNYMAIITICCFNEDSIGDIAPLFYSL